jgi:Domain of Unknown Function (DUF1080)
MIRTIKKIATASFCMVLLSSGNAIAQKKLTTNKHELVFSAIKGTQSKPDTIILVSQSAQKISGIKTSGTGSAFFKIISPTPTQLTPQKKEIIIVVFEPSSEFTGLAEATIQLPGLSIPLRGLSTKGLEGENEAPLAMVVAALGYTIDVGWKTLANHAKPEIQGEELASCLFTKATNGPVEIIPVARYSPDFPLNFGYYTNSSSGPQQFQAGILAKAGKFPEHQTLFPRVAKGGTSIDPGEKTFGFYAISPDHTLYSEDCWNILFHPSKATHATRIYPIKDKTGKLVDNTYLLCMEEALNGDFNDYVFVIKNVKPAFIQDEFSTIMNGKNLDGWHTWFQTRGKNNDPEKVFTLEEGGVLHDTGKELGYIITEQSFSNFHFKLEFKWGEKKWAPRDQAKRDSGICYNIPADAEDFIWPPSVECQIQEGDVGDFWLLEYSTIQVDGKQNAPSNHTQMVKKKDGEKPTGEWNTVEVISFNGKCVHIVNGVVVNYGENSSLIGGRILLQSEYAEIFYKNVKLRKL